MNSQPVNRPQTEAIHPGNVDSQLLLPTSRFQRAVSFLSSCLPRSNIRCNLTPIDAARKYAILRKLPANSQNTYQLMRTACSKMTIEQVADFVEVFSDSSDQKRAAMHRALEIGGSALQFVVDHLNSVFPHIPDHSVYASISLFSNHGPLQTAILQRANETFRLFDGWALLGLMKLGAHISDAEQGEGVLKVLLDQPWTRQMLNSAHQSDFNAEETASALVALSALDSTVQAKLQLEFEQGDQDNLNSFIRHGLGDPELSAGQQSKLAQTFLDMTPSARLQTVNGLKGSKSIAGIVKTLPTYWSHLSEGERRVLINLSSTAESAQTDTLGTLATDSEGILSQRPLVHQIVSRTGLTKLKQQIEQSNGTDALNNAFQSCVAKLKQTLETEIRDLKQRGQSAQVPELAQSFLQSAHFKSNVLIHGLSLRDTLVTVSMLSGPDFDHLPWATGYTASTHRKGVIDQELIAQLADSRIANGDQQSCYEGSIERVVMALRPLLDLAPPVPSTQEFFAAFPRVFNQLLQALDQDSASCEQLASKRQFTKPGEPHFSGLDLYQALEPEIQLLMAREFPSLSDAERKGEALQLFNMAKSYVNELDLPKLGNLPIAR